MGTILDKKVWAEEFLKQFGNANPSPALIKFVEAWEILESGTGPVVGCDHNPLNTTQDWPGATNCNSVGVKKYATYQDGLQATAKVLTNGLYPSLSNALKTNDAGNLGMSGKAMAGNIVGDLSVWATGKRTDATYAQKVAHIAGEPNLPSGGDLGQVKPEPLIPPITDPLSAIQSLLGLFQTFTNPNTWIRVGLFLFAILLLVIGFLVLTHPEQQGGASNA